MNNVVPVDTHKVSAHVGMFPRPMVRRSRPNYLDMMDNQDPN